MGGESRNTFFTLHWKDSVVLCCIPAGNHRASTRQKHLTAHGAAALMATKYLFTELCFSVSAIPWGHCGVGASLGQPSLFWGMSRGAGVAHTAQSPLCRHTAWPGHPKNLHLPLALCFSACWRILLTAACSGAWKTRLAWPCCHSAAHCSTQSPPSTLLTLM